MRSSAILSTLSLLTSPIFGTPTNTTQPTIADPLVARQASCPVPIANVGAMNFYTIGFFTGYDFDAARRLASEYSITIVRGPYYNSQQTTEFVAVMYYDEAKSIVNHVGVRI